MQAFDSGDGLMARRMKEHLHRGRSAMRQLAISAMRLQFTVWSSADALDGRETTSRWPTYVTQRLRASRLSFHTPSA